MKRKKEGKKCLKRRIFLSLLVLVLIFAADIFAFAKDKEPGEAEFYSRGMVLMDGNSGRILYGKEENETYPMASTTKIMTLILALETSCLEDPVKVSSYAASMPDVQMNICEGESYYLKDLLYALMLESYNDVAVAIAEHVGGSVEGFAKMMNEKAAQIGCENTYFITPNGLDKEDEKGVHRTTASDLAKIMRYCVTQSPCADAFLEITQTPSYQLSDVEGKRNFQCTNHNALLSMRGDVISGKTGFTGNAGYCYVCAAKRDDRLLIASFLGCGWPPDKNRKWQDAGKILDYGFEEYTLKNVTDGIKIPEEIQVKNGYFEKAALYGEIKEFPVLVKETDKITVSYRLKKELEAPIKTDTEAGVIEVCLNDEKLMEVPVKTSESIKKRDLKYWFLTICDQLFHSV